MKRILFALAVAGIIGMTSCKKENEVKPVKKAETATGKVGELGGWD